jgi:hypothetical protein
VKEKSSIEIFDELHGVQLSAVTFVHDYLQLWFDGSGINVTNPLTVQAASAKTTSWQPGFRDALCAQITKVVASSELRPNDAFIIRFTDGSLVSVSLRPEDYTSAEAIFAHGFKHNGWLVA